MRCRRPVCGPCQATNTHGTDTVRSARRRRRLLGSNTQTGATAFSDKSTYAEVGLKVGTHKIALLAYKVGITTPLSTNPAMTIGGLTVGLRQPPAAKEDRMNNVLRFYS